MYTDEPFSLLTYKQYIKLEESAGRLRNLFTYVRHTSARQETYIVRQIAKLKRVKPHLQKQALERIEKAAYHMFLCNVVAREIVSNDRFFTKTEADSTVEQYLKERLEHFLYRHEVFAADAIDKYSGQLSALNSRLNREESRKILASTPSAT